jgi:hypothetical protein
MSLPRQIYFGHRLILTVESEAEIGKENTGLQRVLLQHWGILLLLPPVSCLFPRTVGVVYCRVFMHIVWHFSVLYITIQEVIVRKISYTGSEK